MTLKNTMESSKCIKFIFNFYIGCTIISYLYCVLTSTFNGDFMNEDILLNQFLLFINLIFNLCPFYFIYYLYKKKKNHISKGKKLQLPIKTIEKFTIFLYVIYLLLTIRYDVGKAGGEIYSAPPVITLIIQIVNRLSPKSWITFTFFLTKDKRIALILSLLMILNALVTGFFGTLLYLLFLIIIKYNNFWVRFYKRHKLLIGCLIFLFSLSLGPLYDIRDQIRGTYEQREYSGLSIFAGKFIGRMSSYSDGGMIIQRAPILISEMQQLSDIFFIKNMLSILHSSFKDINSPEKILSGSLPEHNISFMCGTAGILYISLYKSLLSFFINLCVIILIDFLVYNLAGKMKFPLCYEFAFMSIINPTMSGVGYEYLSPLWGLFIIYIFTFLFRILIRFNDAKSVCKSQIVLNRSRFM